MKRYILFGTLGITLFALGLLALILTIASYFSSSHTIDSFSIIGLVLVVIGLTITLYSDVMIEKSKRGRRA